MSTRLLLVAGFLGSIACAHRAVPVRSPGDEARPEPEWVLATADLGTQNLFRVRYDGPRGAGGLRLTLRLATRDRFQLVASDLFGKAVWSMEAYDGRLLLVDHSAKTYCESGVDLMLPEVALDPLPVWTIPSVLLGYLPVGPDSDSTTGESSFDFTDSEHRRWRGSLQAGRVSSWMLWHGEQPVLWWKRQDKGGMLSHREGEQLRWKMVVTEPLESGFERLTVPENYQRAACYESHL